MKILILTAFFPPHNAIASQRPLSWAKAWSEAGHDVVVLTVDRTSIERLESSRPLLSSQGSERVRLVTVGLPSFLGWLRKRYKRSQNINRGSNGFSNQSLSRSTDQTLKSRLLSALKSRGLLSSVRWPDMHGLWVKPALRAVRDEHFDVVISTFGPPAVLSVGYALKSRGQTNTWIVDYRDLWTENPSFSGFPIIRWMERFTENLYLKRADAVTTVSQPLAKTLSQRVKNVRVFPNGFANGFEGIRSRPVAMRAQSLKKVIRYTGSLYWPHQNPTALFKVLKSRLDRGDDTVTVEFYGPSLAKIVDLASDFGVSKLVQVYDPVDREAALHLQREADALLFLESPATPGREGILTGKIFEYLAARKPILAIGVGDRSLVGDLVSEADAGLCAEHDENKIASFLEALTKSQLSFQLRGCPERFYRKDIAENLLRFIENVYSRERSSADSGDDHSRITPS